MLLLSIAVRTTKTAHCVAISAKKKLPGPSGVCSLAGREVALDGGFKSEKECSFLKQILMISIPAFPELPEAPHSG